VEGITLGGDFLVQEAESRSCTVGSGDNTFKSRMFDPHVGAHPVAPLSMQANPETLNLAVDASQQIRLPDDAGSSAIGGVEV
jgi:hypothetical protein